MGGAMVSNIGGGNLDTGVFDYGISGLLFVSSQAVSGGSIYGNWKGQVISDSYIANDITLTNITQITNRSHTNLSDIGTGLSSHLQIEHFMLSGDKWYDVYKEFHASASQYTNWLVSGEKLSRWFTDSSNKLGESSQKYTDLYTWYGVSVSSSQYPNWLASGEKLSRWYTESSAKISLDFYNSGEKTWDAWKWYSASSAQFGNWLASGEKLSRWYTESSMKIAEAIYNSGAKNYEVWKWFDSSGNQFDNWLDSGEKLSRWFSESSQILGNLQAGFAPSNMRRYGWASVADAGTIAHGIGAVPTYTTVSPSGASPIVYSFKVDATNITVYHTSPDSEVFSWHAKNGANVT
jgi:hypothetical protein